MHTQNCKKLLKNFMGIPLIKLIVIHLPSYYINKLKENAKLYIKTCSRIKFFVKRKIEKSTYWPWLVVCGEY